MCKYKLERSQQKEDWWVCTDTENLVVCTFQEGKFDETQKFASAKCEEDIISSRNKVAAYLRAMNELTGWLAINHYTLTRK